MLTTTTTTTQPITLPLVHAHGVIKSCVYAARQLASNWCVCIHLLTEPPWGRSGRGRGAGRVRGRWRWRKMTTAGFFRYPALIFNLFYYNIFHIQMKHCSINNLTQVNVRFHINGPFSSMIMHTVQWSYEWGSHEGDIESCQTQTNNGS